MIYIVLAVILVVIGALDIGPYVEALEDNGVSMMVKSALMILTLGIVPAVLIGITVIGDTFWNRRSR